MSKFAVSESNLKRFMSKLSGRGKTLGQARSNNRLYLDIKELKGLFRLVFLSSS